MANPGSFADTVKHQADIVRVVGDYVRLKKTGAQNFSGLCPFHKEKSPSFSVHTTRQFFHCFGCGASGDVFSFVQKLEGLSFPEAVRAVAQKLGIAAPKQSFSPEEAREAQVRTALLEMHEKACEFFEAQLRRPEGAGAREYLAQRGLTAETIRKFRIGFAPDSGFALRDLLRGMGEELLRASGLFSWKESDEASGRNSAGKDEAAPSSGASAKSSKPTASLDSAKPTASLYAKFRARIMFPICNESGRVIAFTGRRLSNDDKAGPKYLNSPETALYSKGRVLFNLDKAKDAIRALDYAILVEGQMDCIALDSAGLHNVIASSGTAFTEAQARLLGRASRNIVVNFDPDTAGAAAAERSLALLVEEDFQIKVLTLEQGLDPDLFIRQRGAAEYGKALAAAPKYFAYLVERARALYPPRTPENKAKAVNYVLPHLHRVQNRIVRDELAADMAQKLGIDSAVLRDELRKVVGARSGCVGRTKVEITEVDRLIVNSLLDRTGSISDEFKGRLGEFLARERIHEPLASAPIVDALIAAGITKTSEDAIPDSERPLLAQLLFHEISVISETQVRSAVDALLYKALAKKKAGLDKELSRLGGGNNLSGEARNLAIEQQRLAKLIRHFDEEFAASARGPQ